MSPGKRFELDFQASAKQQGIYKYRLRDCGGWKGNELDQQSSLRFTPSNSYDLILFHQGNMFALELKSVAGTSFPFPKTKANGSPHHQVEGLLEASEYNVTAGYVINFRKYPATFFVPIETFAEYMLMSSRKSLPFSTAQELGIMLPHRQLKVNFRYDLTPLIKAGKYETA